MGKSHRRWYQVRLRSLFLLTLICAVGLGIWTAGQAAFELMFWVLFWASIPFIFPWSYVTIPLSMILLARRNRAAGFRRFVCMAAALTIVASQMEENFWWPADLIPGSYHRPVTSIAGPIYFTLLAFRVRRWHLIRKGDLVPNDTIALALFDVVIMVSAGFAVWWFADCAEQVWKGNWRWTTPVFDRRMPYLLLLCRIAAVALLWPAIRRGWTARRLWTTARISSPPVS